MSGLCRLSKIHGRQLALSHKTMDPPGAAVPFDKMRQMFQHAGTQQEANKVLNPFCAK
jgi:hypothetical protein